ncbi:pinensin family lanthipeptide [Roseivirga sp. BDSF3-8]|uniref:pinensin family lanthipeptide n=1 Tax=Roseivirga sp. BDSF3-8 TaxID=3241598 RepID=UPI0035327F76
MKKKLSLNDLKVKSFVTDAKEIKSRGGLNTIDELKKFSEGVSDCGGVCSCFGTCDAMCQEY